MFVQPSSAPGIPLRVALRNGRYTRRLPNSPCGHSLSAIYGLRQSNGYTTSSRLEVPHERGFLPCAVRGDATDRGSLSNLYGHKRQPQSQGRYASTQAVDTGSSASNASARSSPTKPPSTELFPEPYCKLTEEYAREHAPLPSQNKYSALPDLLSSPRISLSTLRQKNIVEIDTAVASLDSLQAVICKLVCCIAPVTGVTLNEPVEVAGLGKNSHAAQDAAYVFLVSALHTRGYLDVVVESLKHCRDTRAHHFDLSEIYDYASRFAALPEVYHRASLDPGFTSQSWHEVRIELPEQDIRVVATKPTLTKAITEAANSFIAQTQHYSVDKSPKTVINDNILLTADTASSFLDFYLQKYGQYSEIDVRCTQMKVDSATIYYGTLYIDGQPISEPVMADSEKAARPLAQLAGAVQLIRKDPSFWSKFVEDMARREQYVDFVSASVAPKTLTAIQSSLECLQKVCPANQPETQETRSNGIESLYQRGKVCLDHRTESVDPDLLFGHRTVEEARSSANASLARRYAKQILDAIEENAVNVIVGPPGSGKTSQIPQMVLENAPSSNIIVAQSRRFTAKSMARHVAFERGEKLGQTIGYQTGWDNLKPLSCGITYSTTGALLSNLLHGEDSVLDTVSHIFVDEAQERDVPTDFLLAVLRRAVNRRANLSKAVPKIIIMSADPESDVFEKYMGTISEHGESIPVARTVIPDPAHPVQRYFLEDILHTLFSAYPSEDLIPWVSEPFTAQCISEEKNITTLSSPEGNGESNSPNSNTLLEQPAVRELPGAGKHQFVPVGLIAATIAHIAKNESDGVILAILPGLDLMKRLEQMLYGLPLGVEFKDENQFQILKLHAGFGDMNADVLRPVKKGCRKIILSTNVAETFINIPEVRYVVDSGKTHDSIYDFTTGRRELIRNWIDKPTFRQRQAYTGLTGNGSYYAMFTDARADTLAKSVTPKINNRRDIETECLLLSATIPGLHLHDFLRQLPDPPSLGRIDHTISSLTKRGVIDDSGNVTALGRILSVLPVDIMAGKIVMLGIILRCFEPALVLGAAMHAPPFFIPSGGNLLRRKFAFNSDSDQLAILKAYQTIRRLSNEEGKDAAQKFCSSHAISYPAYLAMEEFISGMVPTLRNFNLISESQANGQLHGGTLNENSKNQPLLSALIAGSVAPNIAIKTRDSGTIWRTRRFPMAIVSNKSPNAHKKCSKGRMLVFRDALKFTTYAPMTLVDTTMLHPLIACLLGGELLNRRDNTLLIDSFLPIKVELPNGSFERNSTAASMIVQARKLIDEAFTISYENLASNNLSEVDEVRHQTIVTQIADMVAAFSDMRRPQPPIRQNR